MLQRALQRYKHHLSPYTAIGQEVYYGLMVKKLNSLDDQKPKGASYGGGGIILVMRRFSGLKNGFAVSRVDKN